MKGHVGKEIIKSIKFDRKRFKDILPVEELQIVTHEFLTLLSELSQTQTITTTNRSLIQSLLHIMTDLETQLSIVQIKLERVHLINNDIEITHSDIVG